MAVPVEEKTLSWMDPYQEAQGEEEESLKVLLVPFKASGNMDWLEKGLGFLARWWMKNHHRVPLICEVLELLKKQRPSQGAQRLLPKQASSILPLRIRGKVLWFQNQLRYVVLALKTGEEAASLQHFLDELLKDVESLSEQDADRKQQKRQVPEEETQVVERALEILRDHSACRSAKFFPSRSCFQVVLQNKTCEEFRVKDLTKKRKESLNQDDSSGIETVFDKAVQQALNFLNGDIDHPVPIQQGGEPAASSSEHPPALTNS